MALGQRPMEGRHVIYPGMVQLGPGLEKHRRKLGGPGVIKFTDLVQHRVLPDSHFELGAGGDEYLGVWSHARFTPTTP